MSNFLAPKNKKPETNFSEQKRLPLGNHICKEKLLHRYFKIHDSEITFYCQQVEKRVRKHMYLKINIKGGHLENKIYTQNKKTR